MKFIDQRKINEDLENAVLKILQALKSLEERLDELEPMKCACQTGIHDCDHGARLRKLEAKNRRMG